MVNRVVATKLTDEEHTQLLDACNKEGCTPSAFIKNALLDKITPKQESLLSDEVRKFVGVTRVPKSNEAIPEKKHMTLEEMLRKYKESKNQKA